MDFGKSPQEVVLECATVSGDRSITSDLSVSPLDETATNETLTTDDPQSVDAPALSFEDTISPAEKDAAKSYPAETLDDRTLSVLSSAQCATEESQSRALSHMKSTLQEFETLRVSILSQLKTANGVNEDEDPTTVEAKIIIQRLLKSLELGIGELQACIIHTTLSLLYSMKRQINAHDTLAGNSRRKLARVIPRWKLANVTCFPALVFISRENLAPYSAMLYSTLESCVNGAL